MNKGLDLWNRALKSIPGGNGLLSKRPERYLPDLWPTYYSKSKGVFVWDLDDKKYIDMAQMAIGSAILGYSDDDVKSLLREFEMKYKRPIQKMLIEYYNAKNRDRLVILNSLNGKIVFIRSEPHLPRNNF